jgi:hypothetical protein
MYAHVAAPAAVRAQDAAELLKVDVVCLYLYLTEATALGSRELAVV